MRCLLRSLLGICHLQWPVGRSGTPFRLSVQLSEPAGTIVSLESRTRTAPTEYVLPAFGSSTVPATTIWRIVCFAAGFAGGAAGRVGWMTVGCGKVNLPLSGATSEAVPSLLKASTARSNAAG